MGSELRKDYFGNWVLIAEGRKFRPKNIITKEEKATGVDPFKPGNESMTPPETDRIEKDDGWVARSFPNKFSFAPEGQVHEVIVETRIEGKRLSSLKDKEMLALYSFYQKSYRVAGSKGFPYLFKNEGAAAGASIPHAHSQLITTRENPEINRVEKKVLDFAKIMRSESDYVFFEDNNFFAYCPKASRSKLEAWIVCKRKNSSLKDLSTDELVSASNALLKVMKKLDFKLSKPAFNLLHHDHPNYHVHVVPRLAVWAGVELGLNIFVNSVAPEEAVRFYGK